MSSRSVRWPSCKAWDTFSKASGDVKTFSRFGSRSAPGRGRRGAAVFSVDVADVVSSSSFVSPITLLARS